MLQKISARYIYSYWSFFPLVLVLKDRGLMLVGETHYAELLWGLDLFEDVGVLFLTVLLVVIIVFIAIGSISRK